MKRVIFIVVISFFLQFANAQEKKIVATAWDGVIMSGYVDQGAFVNFGGPSIKYIAKPMSIGFGVLPTMRIKQDQSGTTARNSWVTPSLGYGITFAYKHLALQIPFYYNAKTGTPDGRWNPGFGVGYKF